MNAALWRLAQGAAARGWRAQVVPFGFAGLLDGATTPLTEATAAPFARAGGAWPGVARVPDFAARLDAAVAGLGAADGLVVLGGNGSLAAAAALARAWGRPVVAIPATIDNDIGGTDITLGHDSAVAYGVRAADRLADTAAARPALFCLETLGGASGHLAAAIGGLAGADAVLLPERAVDAAKVALALGQAAPGLIVAGEGVPDLRGVLAEICRLAGQPLRLTVLGHAQRGGAPGPRDRALAARWAEIALDGVAAGESGFAARVAGAAGLRPFAALTPPPPPDPAMPRGLL